MVWAPIYLRGLLLPGERKSIEPLAATGNHDGRFVAIRRSRSSGASSLARLARSSTTTSARAFSCSGVRGFGFVRFFRAMS